MGGVGKTALAVEYAYRYAHEYAYVFWVRAEENLKSQFADLPIMLGRCDDKTDIETRFAMAKAWFDRNTGWLLVFDSATDAKSLQEYRPKRGGHVLITSRTRNVWEAAELRLEVWSEAQAVEYLQDRLKDVGITTEDAQALAKTLGYLPLALAQSAAYIIENAVSAKTYLNRFNSPQYNVLNEGELDDYEKTVAKTWNISFKAVRKRVGKKFAELEPRVLALYTTLVPDAIPRRVFHADEALQPGLEKWLAELNRYSLIELDPSKEMVSVHRLVQRVMQASPKCPNRRTSLEWTINAVAKSAPRVVFENWGLLAELLPHWEVCWKGIEAEGVVSEAAGALLSQFGYYLSAKGQHVEAEVILEQAQSIWSDHHPMNNINVANNLNNLAMVYHQRLRLIDAEKSYKQALELRQSCLPKEHLDIAQSLNNLGSLYVTQRRFKEAEPLLKQALEIRQQSLPQGHPDISISLNNLAFIFLNQKHFPEAEKCYRLVLTMVQNSLAQGHPDIAHSLNNLGGFYVGQSRFKEAEPLLKQALEIRQNCLSPEHPDIAQSLQNLGSLYIRQGQYAKAEPFLIQVLDIQEKIYGKQHSGTQTTLLDLYILYRQQNKINRMREMREQYPEVHTLFQRMVSNQTI